MEEYVVEAIEDDRLERGARGRRIRKYLVRWVGYRERTWEPVQHLKNARDILVEYNARKTAAQSIRGGNAGEDDALVAVPPLSTSASPVVNSAPLSTSASPVHAAFDEAMGEPNDGTAYSEDETSEQADRADSRRATVSAAMRPTLRMRSSSAANATNKGKSPPQSSRANEDEPMSSPDQWRFRSDDDNDSNYSEGETKRSDGLDDDSISPRRYSTTVSTAPVLSNPRRKNVAKPTVVAKRRVSRKVKPPPRTFSTEIRVGSHEPDRPERPSLDGFLDSEADSVGDEDSSSDRSELSDEDIRTVIEVDEASGSSSDEEGDSAVTRELSPADLREMAETGFVDAYYGPSRDLAYEANDLCIDPSQFTTEAESASQSLRPIDVFFFFLPKKMWRDIAAQSNKYERDTRQERLRAARARYDSLPERLAEAKYAKARKAIESFREIHPREILRVLGLLIARSLNPHKAGIEKHWAKTGHGAVPAGTWGDFIPRERFREIFRFIHFSDNGDPRAKQDRAWKIRPVIDVLQDTFSRGMKIGRWVAFDEMVIPSRSSRNTIRIYLKNKPHKYGTKLFAVCCGETKYCARVDVYCGSRQDLQHVDTLAGPAAVLRNIRALWPSGADKAQKRVVVTDREYTSVSLVTRLLSLGFYSISTVTPSRLGFPKRLKYPFKTVPKSMAGKRGLCRLVRSVEFPDVFACSWLDNKPVYFLASGVSSRKTSIRRKTKNGSSIDVPCPEFVEAYNDYMNGVDTHDQLRLQRYSVQRAVRFAKYYKMLFLGLFDMGIVNAYIVYREYCKSNGIKALNHAKFRLVLHQQLLQLEVRDVVEVRPQDVSEDMAMRSPSYSGTVTTHNLVMSTDKKPSGGLRFRVCKVCATLHQPGQPSPSTTRHYCEQCSSEKGRVYLCNVVKRDAEGNQLTCFQTWHQLWKNGTNRFDGRNIRIRRPAADKATRDEDEEEFVVYTPSAPTVFSPAIY